MFNYIKTLLLVTILMVTYTPFQVYATEHDFFAQIQTDGVYLFEDKGTKPIFEIPPTFYVKLIEDEVDGYYKARYMNVVGYIRSSEIQCVDEYPAIPYLDYVNFRILASQSAELRNEPSRAKGLNSLIVELPLYETNFIYYGNIQGEEVVPALGNNWYYVSYSKNGVTQYGYIYSGLTDNLTAYTQNPISLYPITKHNWYIEEEQPNLPAFDPPSTPELAIILAIIIPALLLLFIMFKTGNKTTKSVKQHSDIIKMPTPTTSTSIPRKKKKGQDYYEIE